MGKWEPRDLTEEQKNLLIRIGKPDDGSQVYVPDVSVRITGVLGDLINLGLVQYTGKDSTGSETFALTDEGEYVYGELTGDS
jgi:hypothetical protein